MRLSEAFEIVDSGFGMYETENNTSIKAGNSKEIGHVKPVQCLITR